MTENISLKDDLEDSLLLNSDCLSSLLFIIFYKFVKLIVFTNGSGLLRQVTSNKESNFKCTGAVDHLKRSNCCEN